MFASRAVLARLGLRVPKHGSLSAAFHTGRLAASSKAAAGTPAAAPAIDKTNPLYAPDNFEPWRNAGYTNLAPKGWNEWSDLPAPYKYFEVKVDPKDVETEGLVWKTFTNWKTAIPVTALLALPAFVFDVVVVDERFELMLIFWSTMAMFQANFGGAVKKTLTDQIEQIKNELYGAEKKYNTALENCLDAHKKGQYLVDHVKTINAADRAIKAVEAAAKTRALKIEQRNKYVEMLDYLVAVTESKSTGALQEVVSRSRSTVETKLTADAALQQKLIENAILALQTGEKDEETVPSLVHATVVETGEALQAELASGDALDSRVVELFQKRFDFSDEVTPEMLQKAKADPKEWALLVGKVAGQQPVVGMPLYQRSPLEFVE